MPNEKLMAEIMDGLERLAKQMDEKNIPQTNADRIRAMSDEELERFLGQYSLCTRVGWCPDHGKCHQCVLDWLRQPVKDGDNE